MEKIKIFYDEVSKVEVQSNTWLNSNNIIIKNIKTEMNGYYLILILLYEDNVPNLKPSCIYEPDNTTAMNCKWCGKSKWLHNEHPILDMPMSYPSDND